MEWKLNVPLRKISKILLAGAMGFTCLHVNNLQVQADSYVLQDDAALKEALEIYFDEPVSQGTLIPNRGGGFGTTEEDNRWQQLSLPIGNSMMGANVYGEVSKEHLTFNQKTLWNGGPSDQRPDYDGGNIDQVGNQSMSDYVKLVQDTFLSGDVEKAKSMCGSIVGEKNGYGAYQSFGDIYLDFKLNGTASNYRRNLDLNTAVANVDFTMNGTEYHREYFASYPDNVIAMKVSAKGSDTLNFNVTFPIDNATTNNLQKTVKTTVADDKITVNGYMNDNQMKLNGQLKVVSEDGVITANKDSLDISNATEAIIFLSASTDYENTYPVYRSGESDEELNQRVADVIHQASDKGYDAVKETAIHDYTEIFDRVTLNLGQEAPGLTTDVLLTNYNNGTATSSQKSAIETTLFQFGRYLQIASSREGDLPANLQGVWNNRVGDENRVPWASDYHMNVNLQMNYWPSYNTNMAECATPLIDYIDSLREPGRVTAETYFGVVSDEENPENGFSAHTQNTPFGWTTPGWAFSWGWSPAAVPWILQNVYEYYEYTGDDSYLRNKIYPMLKEEAKLYQQILREDPETGRLITVPAYSPEHGPYTAGNTYEQSLVWQLYKDSIEAATALGVDAELVAQWKEIQSKLDPIEIGSDGQIKEWYDETSLGSIPGSDPHHRHMSHLLGVFPGDLVSVDNQAYLDAAIVSLDARGDDATGWGMGQRLNTWARVGDGNHAYAIIQAFFRGGAYPNLWDAHAPFQIDGNFGYTAGVAEMLMQSNMGYINLLPALPDSWPTGHVDGLVARGNFEVAIDWDKMNATSVEILSNNGGDCSIQYPNISQAVVKHNGNVVETSVDSANRITFASEKGATYTIEEIPEKPLKAPSSATSFTDGNETLIDFAEDVNADAYVIYRSVDGEVYEKVDTIDHAPYRTNDTIPGATYKVAAIDKKGNEGTLSATLHAKDLTEVYKMDDRDSSIAYSAGWGNWDDGGQYLGTEKYTEATGSSLEFYFAGTGLRVIGMTTTNTHTYDLYIDDELVLKDVDTYSTKTVRQAVLSETKGLKDGIHKARLYVSKAKISLDAFEIIRDVKPKGLTITSDADTMNLNVANTMQMKATYIPTGVGDAKNVTWSVENDLGYVSNIASINDAGVLTATNPGTVVVKAYDDLYQLHAKKTITVTNDDSVMKYDDRDASVIYSSNWAPWDEGKHEFGTITETTTKDSSFTFDFTGTGISLYFMKLEAAGGSAGANIEVFIDGESAGTHSTFSTVPGSEPKQKIFEKQDLENTTHTIKVVVGNAGAGAPSGSTPKVSFDYYEVTTPGSESFQYDALRVEMQTFMDMDLSGFTEASRSAYEAAFEEAKALYEAADSQTAIDQMTTTLIEKREALQAAESENFLKNMLLNAITKAQGVSADHLDTLAPTVKTAFIKALGDAKNVYEDENASVDQILRAWNRLADVMHYLDFEANKTALNALIEKCKDINPDDYTIGVEEYKSALEEAINVSNDENALQKRIDLASARLTAAIAGLSSQEVNKAALKQLLSYADAIMQTSDLYAKDGAWEEFTKAYEEAQNVNNNATANQNEINVAVANLANAYENIRLLPNEELLRKLTSYIEAANAIDPRLYAVEDYAYIMRVKNNAEVILQNNDTTQAEIADIYAQINKAYAIMQDEKLQEPQAPLEEQPEVTAPVVTKTPTGANGTTKPSTGDTTAMNTLAITTLAAGAIMFLLRKRKQS